MYLFIYYSIQIKLKKISGSWWGLNLNHFLDYFIFWIIFWCLINFLTFKYLLDGNADKKEFLSGEKSSFKNIIIGTTVNYFYYNFSEHFLKFTFQFNFGFEYSEISERFEEIKFSGNEKFSRTHHFFLSTKYRSNLNDVQITCEWHLFRQIYCLDIPRKTWCILKRFQCSQRDCGNMHRLWNRFLDCILSANIKDVSRNYLYLHQRC